MSAFVVLRPHIDSLGPWLAFAIGCLALAGSTSRRINAWPLAECSAHSRELRLETAEQVGQMLWAENVRSVNHRYGTRESADQHRFSLGRVGGTISPVAILSALACYEYQSCEHPAWDTSEAKQFCDALRLAAIRRLPGYNDAPWDVTDLSQVMESRLLPR